MFSTPLKNRSAPQAPPGGPDGTHGAGAERLHRPTPLSSHYAHPRWLPSSPAVPRRSSSNKGADSTARRKSCRATPGTVSHCLYTHHTQQMRTRRDVGTKTPRRRGVGCGWPCAGRHRWWCTAWPLHGRKVNEGHEKKTECTTRCCTVLSARGSGAKLDDQKLTCGTVCARSCSENAVFCRYCVYTFVQPCVCVAGNEA